MSYTVWALHICSPLPLLVHPLYNWLNYTCGCKDIRVCNVLKIKLKSLHILLPLISYLWGYDHISVDHDSQLWIVVFGLQLFKSYKNFHKLWHIINVRLNEVKVCKLISDFEVILSLELSEQVWQEVLCTCAWGSVGDWMIHSAVLYICSPTV